MNDCVLWYQLSYTDCKSRQYDPKSKITGLVSLRHLHCASHYNLMKSEPH